MRTFLSYVCSPVRIVTGPSLCPIQIYDATNSTRERRKIILDHCLINSIKVGSLA